MNKFSAPFEAKYNRYFEKQLAKLRKRDKTRAERILKRTQEICATPYDVDTRFAKGEYRGKREGRAGDDRFLFVVCKQCRELGHMSMNGCPVCSEIKDETVIFVMMIEGHKY